MVQFYEISPILGMVQR